MLDLSVPLLALRCNPCQAIENDTNHIILVKLARANQRGESRWVYELVASEAALFYDVVPGDIAASHEPRQVQGNLLTTHQFWTW